MPPTFDLVALSNALPAGYTMTLEEEQQYNALWENVAKKHYGFQELPSRRINGEFYAVWAGIEHIGVYATCSPTTRQLCSAAVQGKTKNFKKFDTWKAAVDAIAEHIWTVDKRYFTAAGPAPHALHAAVHARTVPEPLNVQPRTVPQPFAATPSTPTRTHTTSPSTPSSVSRSSVTSSTRIFLAPGTPKKASTAIPMATPLRRRAPEETVYLVTGKRSASFFLDEDSARTFATSLQELDELVEFSHTTDLAEALEVLKEDAERLVTQGRN
ncbi:hypothetical protein C8F01DRAFT_1085807 [Mycena amicta]|nr:hypothetical protein C8F01DRAFT_1085807 [Mycena amicta]